MATQPTQATAERVRSTRAFTLVEVLIALAILAIALVALIQLHINSIRMAQRADQLFRASLLADTQLTRVVSERELRSGADRGFEREPGREDVLFWETGLEGADTGRLWDLDIPRLYRAYAGVAWQDGRSQRQVRLDTYLVQP